MGTTAEETLASLSTWLCPSGVHFMREKTMIQRSGKHDGDVLDCISRGRERHTYHFEMRFLFKYVRACSVELTECGNEGVKDLNKRSMVEIIIDNQKSERPRKHCWQGYNASCRAALDSISRHPDGFFFPSQWLHVVIP